MTGIAKSLLLLFLTGVLVSPACTSKKSSPAAGARQTGPLQVQGFRVETGNVSESIEVPGSLVPAEQTQIRSEVSGRVVQLNIIEGNVVPKGTLLVKLFDEDLQAQLKKLEVQLQIAQKTQERQQKLLAINGISQQEYELSSLDVDNLKADIQATRIAIARTEIRAPYAGKIGLRNISLGSFISPTDVITSIRQVDQLKLEFSIPEKYAQHMTKGYQLSFKVAAGKQMYPATVLATENTVDAETRTLRVKALVNGQHPDLVPGKFATVNLQLGQSDQALLVPSQAIIPQARNKQVIVYRNDSVQFRTVETGIRDASFVQILTGIEPGDTIVTTGLMAIRPQSKITLTEVSAIRKSGADQ
jgi:membrane fusion protein, multidrug efflux system